VEGADLVAVMLPHDEVTPQPGDRLTASAASYLLTAVHPVRTDIAGPVAHWSTGASRGRADGPNARKSSGWGASG